MVDNLHPNAAGYAVLGRTFYDAIARAVAGRALIRPAESDQSWSGLATVGSSAVW